MEKIWFPLPLTKEKIGREPEFDFGFALGYHYFPSIFVQGRTPLGEKLYKFKYCNKESFKRNYGKECSEDCEKCKKESLECLVDCASEFVEENKFYGGEFYYADIIIGIPPSDEKKEWPFGRVLVKAIGNKIGISPSDEDKKWHPARVLARAIGNKIGKGKRVADYTIKRIKPVPELKDALSEKKRSYDEKAKIIKGTVNFSTEKAKNRVKGKRIFLIDDVYDTGATADAITQLLKQEGQAKAVYFLAITKTQK